MRYLIETGPHIQVSEASTCVPSKVLPLLAATHSPLTKALSNTNELAALAPALGGAKLSMIL